MSQTHTIIGTAVLCCIGIAICETQRRNRTDIGVQPVTSSPARLVGELIFAPGRMTGATEEVSLHSQVIEPVATIHVRQGDLVQKGDLLITLDQETAAQQRNAAAAELEQRESALLRLQNGNRESDISAARTHFDAAQTRLEASRTRLERAKKLLLSNAISRQDFDDLQFDFQTLSSLARTAKSELESIEQPARPEDIVAAEAAVKVAAAKLQMAEHQLSKTKIKAPISGTVLKVNARLGELPKGPAGSPLVIMCDMSRPRALLEVDEYDALRIAIGQPCELTTDGMDGVIARGTITEIEARMAPKQIFGQWAGERNDTFSRRAWVDLDSDSQPLPLGLPVRANISIR